MAIRLTLFATALLIALTIDALAIPIRPDRAPSASTQISVRVPAELASFQNQMLEVTLYEYDPLARGRETAIERHVDRAFRHTRGTETRSLITLGNNRPTMPGMAYYVTVAVYRNNDGKRMHLGEADGKRGPAHVLTDGKPNQVTMTLRVAKTADIVMDVADEIRKGNDAKAKLLAKARASDFEETFDLMDLNRRRNKRGLGWGSTPNASPNLDSLEIMLINLGRAVPVGFLADAKNNEEAVSWIAAMAELTAARSGEVRPMGKKSKLDWEKKAAAVRAEVDVLGKAIAAKNVPAIQQSARAVINACSMCHDIYRD